MTTQHNGKSRRMTKNDKVSTMLACLDIAVVVLAFKVRSVFAMYCCTSCGCHADYCGCVLQCGSHLGSLNWSVQHTQPVLVVAIPVYESPSYLLGCLEVLGVGGFEVLGVVGFETY